MDWPIPHGRQRGRWATARARRQEAILAPEIASTVRRFPVANKFFLGFWTVDICQKGHSLRSAPQMRHTAHLRWHSHGAPRNRAAGIGEVIKTHRPPGIVNSPCTWSPELLRPGKGTKFRPNQVCAFVEYPKT